MKRIEKRQLMRTLTETLIKCASTHPEQCPGLFSSQSYKDQFLGFFLLESVVIFSLLFFAAYYCCFPVFFNDDNEYD